MKVASTYFLFFLITYSTQAQESIDSEQSGPVINPVVNNVLVDQSKAEAGVPQIPCTECSQVTGSAKKLSPLILHITNNYNDEANYPFHERGNAAHAVRDRIRIIRKKFETDMENVNKKDVSSQVEPTIQEKLKSKMEDETGGFSGKFRPGKKGIEIRYKKEWK